VWALLSYQKKKWRRGARKALASNAIGRATIAENVKSLGTSRTRKEARRMPGVADQTWYKSGESKIAFSPKTADLYNFPEFS